MTANVAFPNTHIRFDPIFPRTGGGEDIDFAIKAAAGKLVAVPSASVTHPWWKGGARDYQRFWGWASGDGALGDLYPMYSYQSCWSATELAMGLIGLGTLGFMMALLGFVVESSLQVFPTAQEQQGIQMFHTLQSSQPLKMLLFGKIDAFTVSIGFWTSCGLQLCWLGFKAALVVKATDMLLDVARNCLIQVSEGTSPAFIQLLLVGAALPSYSCNTA